MTAVVAVDAGGTQSRLAFVDGDRRVDHLAGAANATSDFPGAVRGLADGLDALAAKTGLSPDTLRACPACLGVAGVLDADQGRRLAEALQLRNAHVSEDRLIALRGALGDRDGTLAHCGTGSFLARRSGDQVRTVGGWGPVLGDEASAVWLAKSALRAALDVADGLADPCAMTQRIAAEVGGPRDIVAFARDAAATRMGALAPVVTSTAEHSPTASAILTEGAALLAQTARALGWNAGEPLCLTGGLGPEYASYLPDDLQANLEASAGAPIDGAIAMALDLAKTATP